MSNELPVENVLVLGSAGQIGSALVPYLREKGYGVIEFDIVDDPLADLRLWPNQKLKLAMENCDFVFFLAFDVGGSHYLEKYQDSFEFIDNNLRLMSNTFRLLNQAKKPFVFASSQMASMSYSTYGMLKALGEKATQSIGAKTVHFWNVYGYESDESKFHVISDFILQAKRDGEIRMRTTGEESRDFLHVHDCCSALETVMLKYAEISAGSPIHICSNNFITIKQIAELIGEKLNSKIIPGVKKDQVQRDAKKPADLSFRKYWEPSVNLEVGIDEVLSHWT